MTEKDTKPGLIPGKGRVLLVDDEPAIVDGTRQILSELGYTVTATTNSLEALERINDHPDGFDLVITDMTMPGMDGLELAKKIHQVNSDIPIILCTGFSRGLKEEDCESCGITRLMMKPMIAGELSEAVHQALVSGPGGADR